jgi:4'-phosphopantetheinyl transferase
MMRTCPSLSELASASKPDNQYAACTMPVRIATAAPDIEVWQMRLNQDATVVQQFENLLSQDEKLRSQRFHAERHRRRFIVSRGALRVLLGQHMGIPPAEIVFSYASHGKPYLPEHGNHVNFNASHSEECAVYAISRHYQLGIDVEFLHRRIEFDAVAKRFFAPGEYADLCLLPHTVRKRAFMACWTRKEAVIKALGDGLSIPLDQFRVTVDPDAMPRVLETSANHHAVSDWTMYTIDAGSKYYSTIAGYRSHLHETRGYR